jgi:LPXTG-motif cell wall-anchored protein
MRIRILATGTLIAATAMFGLMGAAGAQTNNPNNNGNNNPCAPGQGGTPPSRSQYPPSQCGLRLGQSQARPGEPVSVAGDGYKGNSGVSIDFHSTTTNLSDPTTNGSGSFSTSVVIPSNATPGQHTITATGTNPDGTPRELSAAITITGGSGNLPRTGSSSKTIPLTVGGIGLIVAGGAAVAFARRRRTTTA